MSLSRAGELRSKANAHLVRDGCTPLHMMRVRVSARAWLPSVCFLVTVYFVRIVINDSPS